MKKFKNSFGVKGSPSLLQALKEEAEKLGWKYDSNFSSGYSEDDPDLYFNANEPKDDMKPQHFSFSTVFDCIIYNLPEQWDECLKVASELEEKAPEYVEFIADTFSHFTKGTIYSLNKNGDCQGDSGKYYWAMQYLKDKKFMVPSTKAAYEKQQKKFTMEKLIKEAEKRYPARTKFRCLVTNTVETMPINATLTGKIDSTGMRIFSYLDTGTIFHKHYHNGKWAEIISKPEESMEIAGYNVKFEITLKDFKTMKKTIKIVSLLGRALPVTRDSIVDNIKNSAIFLDEIEQLIERLDG